MGFPGKNTGEGCHFLLQEIFLAQGSSLHLLHWQTSYLPLRYQGNPCSQIAYGYFDNWEKLEFRKTDLSKDQTEKGQPICSMLSPLPEGRKGLEEGVLWQRRWEDVTRTALLADVKPRCPRIWGHQTLHCQNSNDTWCPWPPGSNGPTSITTGFPTWSALPHHGLCSFIFVSVLARLHGLRNLSSPTRDWTQAPAVKAQSPNHRTSRKVLDLYW